MAHAWLYLLAMMAFQSNCEAPFYGERVETGAYKTGRSQNDLFYMLFKARNTSRVKPPLLVWMNGGPGCSSFYGAFAENGPLRITLSSPANVTHNAYGWNNEFDVMYIDSPSGVGYSKLYDDPCTDTNCTMKDYYVFLNKFFLNHTDYLGRDLYLTGECFAGHYIPILAEYILKQNTTLYSLKGVAIGDGWYDGLHQMFGYSIFAYEKGLISTWRFIVAYAIYIFARLCFMFGFGDFGRDLSESIGMDFIVNDKFDVYDIGRKECPPYDTYIIDFLNNPEVVKTLNTTDRPFFKVGDTVACNFSTYFLPEDDFQSVLSRIKFMIDSKLKLLFYTGSLDFICNVKMQEIWMERLMWEGHDAIVYDPYIDWILNSTVSGRYKKYKNFMHLIVLNASHMVPTEQAYPASEMINHFILDEIK
jgi:cathepsin A (carboxypeptidase C)